MINPFRECYLAFLLDWYCNARLVRPALTCSLFRASQSLGEIRRHHSRFHRVFSRLRFCRTRESLSVAIGIVVLLAISAAKAAEISVTADRDPVQLDESFNLIFQVNGSPDDNPDFSPLQKDFQILNRGQSSNISIINGEYSKTAQWHLSVMAKQAGKLTVPPVSFGDDKSQPIMVTVNGPVSSQVNPAPAASAPNLFLEIEAQPENPYVQAQVIYTVRLLHRANIFQAQLTEPETENAIIEKLGDDVSYNTRRHGIRYRVEERKYAIFPQQSGIIMIEPVELNAQIVSSGRPGSRYDDFFGRRSTQTKRVRSKPTALKVKPIPAEYTGTYWLPAEQLSLTEDWPQNPPKLIAGEPITRTLRIEAKGLSVSQLPELNSSNLVIKSIHSGQVKQYPDQPRLEQRKTAKGLISTREEKNALIPSKPGSYHLPAIEIPWWNTQTDRMEIARIPEQGLKALAPASADSPQIPPSPVSRQADEVPQTSTVATSGVQRDQWFWQWIAMVLALGWAGTVFFWWLRKPGRTPSENNESLDSTSKRLAVKNLKRACNENDPQSAKNALLEWAKNVWSDFPPNSLAEIGRRSGGNLHAEIENLNSRLYSNVESCWHGRALWSSFTKQHNEKSAAKKQGAVGLKPLYKGS